MSTSIVNNYPNWGSTGTKPSDGLDYQTGDNPKAEHYDYLWNETDSFVDDVINEFNNEVIRRDGSVAMNAALDFGGNAATSISKASNTGSLTVSADDDANGTGTLSMWAGGTKALEVANSSGDLLDGVGNVVYDQSNNYVPSGRVQSLDGHLSSTTNPHSVTLEQARSQNNSFSGNVELGGGSDLISTGVFGSSDIDINGGKIEGAEIIRPYGNKARINFDASPASLYVDGKGWQVYNDGQSETVMTWNTDSTVQVHSGDITDGASNVVYDQSNNYVPSGRVQSLDGHLSSTTNPHSVTLEQARSQNNSFSGNVNFNGNDAIGINQLKFADSDTDGVVWEIDDAGGDLGILSGSSLIVSFKENNNIHVDNGNINIGGGKLTLSGSTALSSVPASGQTTLSSGSAVVDTGVSATGATFQLALGIDDPNADCKVAGELFWDDSAGTYKVEIQETDTSVGNPTINYKIIRVD